jgi:hypothetical protein
LVTGTLYNAVALASGWFAFASRVPRFNAVAIRAVRLPITSLLVTNGATLQLTTA